MESDYTGFDDVDRIVGVDPFSGDHGDYFIDGSLSADRYEVSVAVTDEEIDNYFFNESFTHEDLDAEFYDWVANEGDVLIAGPESSMGLIERIEDGLEDYTGDYDTLIFEEPEYPSVRRVKTPSEVLRSLYQKIRDRI